MEKIIVEIKCPSVYKSYDFRISSNMLAGKGIARIIEEIRSIEQNGRLFSDSSSAVLISKDTGAVLNREMTFSENGIRSGDTLMII